MEGKVRIVERESGDDSAVSARIFVDHDQRRVARGCDNVQTRRIDNSSRIDAKIV